MQDKLAKYFWILNLVTLVAVAYFAASGTSELVAAEIESTLPEIEHRERPRDRRARLPANRLLERRDGTPILRRNIFDSSVGPIDPTAVAELDDPVIAADEDLPLLECKEAGDVTTRLLATVVSQGNPAWSFASMSSGQEKRLYRMGDEVGGRTISNISWRYVFLRGSRDECYIDLFGDQKPPAKRGRGDQLPARGSVKDGIRVVSDNERVVDRGVLDQALANPAKFARSVRVRPHKKGGEVDGFRIRRVKQDSPLYMLGARRGDVFHAVNGVPLTSVDTALAAYQSLRNEDQLVFEITRKGRPTQLKISVR